MRQCETSFLFVLWGSWSFYCSLPDSIKLQGLPVDARRLVDHLQKKKSPRLLLSATLINNNRSIPLYVLIDSGCEQNLIDSTFVQQMSLETVPLTVPLCVLALDGKALSKITPKTKPVHLIISDNHRELISFFGFPSANSPIILCFQWLQEHNSHINWSDMHIESWSTQCHSSCLHSAVPPGPSPADLQAADPPDLSFIPAVYHDLSPVFSKTKALSLPPHHPYDCAIDLLPGGPLPTSHLYNISQPERETMERYIKDFLAAGIIRPSSPPRGRGSSSWVRKMVCSDPASTTEV